MPGDTEGTGAKASVIVLPSVIAFRVSSFRNSRRFVGIFRGGVELPDSIVSFSSTSSGIVTCVASSCRFSAGGFKLEQRAISLVLFKKKIKKKNMRVRSIWLIAGKVLGFSRELVKELHLGALQVKVRSSIRTWADERLINVFDSYG